MEFFCTICLNDLVVSHDTVSALSCGHTFHSSCVSHWINSCSSPKCVNCKREIIVNKMITPIHLSTSSLPEKKDKIIKKVRFDLPVTQVQEQTDKKIEPINQEAKKFETRMTNFHKLLRKRYRRRKFRRVRNFKNSNLTSNAENFMGTQNSETSDTLINSSLLHNPEIEAEEKHSTVINEEENTMLLKQIFQKRFNMMNNTN